MEGLFLWAKKAHGGEEMIKIDLDLFMLYCFIWVYFRDCRRTNELGTKISWLEEKLR